MKQKLLILGSGGFVLSNFIRQSFYHKKDYSIASIDIVRKSKTMQNIYVNKNHEFYIGDVCDQHFLSTIFEIHRPNIVIHGCNEPNNLIKSNIESTNNVIDQCINYNSKLIYLSTDEVYGPQNTEEQATYKEEDRIQPYSTVASVKASAEMLIQAAHRERGLNYAITRSCNLYGPWQDSNQLIPNMIMNVINNNAFDIKNSGLQIRDYMHVFDFCSGIFKIIDTEQNNAIYNISCKQELSNLEVFQRICNVLKTGYDLIRFGNVNSEFRYANSSYKLRTLGWEPEYKFNTGIEQVVQWYTNNKWFFRT